MSDNYEGIIIKSFNYGEYDKIIHLFTRECGKISCISKNMRLLKRKKGSNLEVFTYGKFSLYSGKNMYTINGLEIEKGFFSFRTDLNRLAYGSIILELLNMTLIENEENIKAFDLTIKTFILLETLEDFKSQMLIILGFQIKYLSFIGYRPILKKCLKCGSLDNLNYFSVRESGVLCTDCKELDKNSIKLDKNIKIFIEHLLYSKLDGIVTMNISNEELEILKNIIFSYTFKSLDIRTLKSLYLIDSTK